MNIETTKLELLERILQTQKESLLTKLKMVIEEDQDDWLNEMTLEEQEEIKTGLAQADRRDYIPHEKIMDRFKKWH